MAYAPLERLDQDRIIAWLREEDISRLAELFCAADQVRAKTVGDQIHLRGLIEISNCCQRNCLYCGLRQANDEITRYRMTLEEIVACARQAKERGYGTVVMQAGEDNELRADWVADLIEQIKVDTGLAITLSLGERRESELRLWRERGADRYLLRFETSDRALFDRIHPPLGGVRSDRFEILARLQRLGYETGSGVMVGIPGQGISSLANDLLLFRDLDLDMVGIGPYLPHPRTPMGMWGNEHQMADNLQVQPTELMVRKCVALTRLLCPEANIPRTTALSVIHADDDDSALNCGANVIMPNLTPMRYRRLYDVYPAKSKVDGAVEAHLLDIESLVARIGRSVGKGPGARQRRFDN